VTLESLARGLEARRVGGSLMARCPAHDDRNPSLSIRETDGKVLVHCHAGCQQRDVIAALRDRGLWEESWQGIITATYGYTDETGLLLYQIVRYVPKTFRQRFPDGLGGWVWKKHPRQVLYRLCEVIEAPIVFLVEGEKDVETLREYGFVATTNAGGAQAPWLTSYSNALAQKEVIIIPDNDVAGWQRATVIARALLGAAARIRVQALPEKFKDISDWFGAGHSECELIAMVEGPDASY
jgi:putative DNA primase/helicase